MKSVSNFNQELQALQQQLRLWLKLHTRTGNVRPEQAQQITTLVQIIQDNTTAKPFQIFVKNYDGKTYTLDIQITNTIREIKNLMEDKTGIPSTEQRLIYQGKQLEDARTIQDQKIEKERTLHLNLRLRGGSPFWALLTELGYVGSYYFLMEYVLPYFANNMVEAIAFIRRAHQEEHSLEEAFENFHEQNPEDEMVDNQTENSDDVEIISVSDLHEEELPKLRDEEIVFDLGYNDYLTVQDIKNGTWQLIEGTESHPRLTSRGNSTYDYELIVVKDAPEGYEESIYSFHVHGPNFPGGSDMSSGGLMWNDRSRKGKASFTALIPLFIHYHGYPKEWKANDETWKKKEKKNLYIPPHKRKKKKTTEKDIYVIPNRRRKRNDDNWRSNKS